MSLLMTELTDAELVPRIARGDEEAVTFLVDRYWARAYGLAYRLVGEPNAAEDVAQDAFVKVIQAAGRFDSARPFRPWFFTVLTNEARKHHRSRTRRADHEQRAATREAVAAPEDHAEAVASYLATLPAAQREPIALHYLAGLTFREVAEVLSCPLGTVTSRVQRGIQDLQTRLQPSYAVGSLTITELLRQGIQAPSAPSPQELLGALQGSAPAQVALAPQAQSLIARAGLGRRLPAWALLLGGLAVAGAVALTFNDDLGWTVASTPDEPGQAQAPKQPQAPKPAPKLAPAPAPVDAPVDAPLPPVADPASPPTPTLTPGAGAAVVRVIGPQGPLAETELSAFLILSRPGGATAGQATLRTDANGWLVIPSLPGAANVSLDLTAGDLRAPRLVFNVEAGGVNTAEAELYRGASVDARLTFSGPAAEVRANLLATRSPDASPGAPARVTSTEVLHLGALAAGSYTLELEALGYAQITRELTLEQGQATDLGEIQLGGAGVLRGRVVRSDGQPASSTLLTVSTATGYLGRAQTDAFGEFQFAGVEPGALTLTFEDGSSHAATVSAPGEHALGTLTLEAATQASVRGRVLGVDGTPRPKVTLTLRSVYATLNATTAADGSFEFADVTPGTVELHVPWGEETSAPRVLDVGEGASVEAELQLTRGGEVRGRVMGETAARTAFLTPTPEAGRLPSQETPLQLDAEGRFVRQGLPPGDYVLQVRGVAPHRVSIQAGQVTEANLVVAGTGSATVRVTGESAPQRFVAMASQEEAMLGMAPGRQGRASFAELPAGSVTVGVVVPGSDPQLVRLVQAVQVRANENVEIAIEWLTGDDTGGIRGKVPLDWLAPGLGVQAKGPQAELMGRLNADGSFELSGLPPGRYRVSLFGLQARAEQPAGEVRVTAGAVGEVHLAR